MFAKTIGPELELRPVEHTHCEALHAMTEANRARFRTWFAWVDGAKSPADAKTFVKSAMETAARDEGFQTVIVWRGRVVGSIGFHNWQAAHRMTSMGYLLDQAAEGKGFMTAAVRAMLDYALIERPMNRVEIRAAVENGRSRAVPERLGFTYEGIARQAEWMYDHYHDLAVYSMLREEWMLKRESAGDSAR